jgi:hypothetical protein
MKQSLTAVTALLLACFVAAPAQAAFSDYGIESVDAGISTNQAGDHPDFSIGFTLKTDPSTPADGTGLHAPYARTRDITVGLPPGLIGNPHAVAECTAAQFATALSGGGCPQDSQIGVAVTRIYTFNYALTEPIYNMTPPTSGAVARLGLYAATSPVLIDVEVRSEGDYGLDSMLRGISGTEQVVGAETTIWGVPASPVHDTERLTVEEAFNGVAKSPPRPSGLPEELPFLTNPTRCGVAQDVRVEADSYQEPGRFSVGHASLPALTGCGKIEFDPTFSANPTTREAAAPSGLDAELFVPQDESVKTLATSQLKDATVTLPTGMTIASGAAEGLEACSASQVGYGSRNPSACPDAAKIGTAEFDVPPLSRTIEGAVYQRTPEPGHLFRIWLVTDELGAHVKIPGEIHADAVSGRISSVFLDNPQVPLERLKLHFFGGPRGVLATPSTCGTYFTQFAFAPWSGRPATTGQTPMTIDQGCATGGFSPRLSAGAVNPTAGGFSPFALSLTRNSNEQNVAGLEVSLPPGAAAKLAGVPLCAAATAATGSCPAASQVGTTTVAAGPGPSPLWIPQPGKAPTAVYLAGPYKGAPYSLVVKTPAQAGPFDLGNVVVRAALYIDPVTAQVTTVADPLPQILEGVPISYRTIHVDINRPNFTTNPTDCSPAAVTARVTSIAGAIAAPRSRYQVGACAALGFKPKLSLRLSGKTRRGGYPALKAVLRARPGDANFEKIVAALPHSAFLEQAHIRTICTRVQYAADNCPRGSVYGRARAISPLVDYPVEGPVYLRSSSNPLPDLVMALKGPAATPVEIDVVGRIDSVNGGIRTSFESTPDLPVSKFILNMQGGKKGLLVNSRNLCIAPNRANVKLKAQNGRTANLRPVLKIDCAAGKSKKSQRHRRPGQR